MRAALALALALAPALAACDDRTGSSPSQEGAAGSASGIWQEACEPHPNGAPCCDQNYRPTPEDCPEGTYWRDSGDTGHPQNRVIECYPEEGVTEVCAPPPTDGRECRDRDGRLIDCDAAGRRIIRGRPYVVTDRETGRVRAYGITCSARICYISTGFQRSGTGWNAAGSQGCIQNCFTEEGRPVDCRAIETDENEESFCDPSAAP